PQRYGPEAPGRRQSRADQGIEAAGGPVERAQAKSRLAGMQAVGVSRYAVRLSYRPTRTIMCERDGEAACSSIPSCMRVSPLTVPIGPTPSENTSYLAAG